MVNRGNDRFTGVPMKSNQGIQSSHFRKRWVVQLRKLFGRQGSKSAEPHEENGSAILATTQPSLSSTYFSTNELLDNDDVTEGVTSAPPEPYTNNSSSAPHPGTTQHPAVAMGEGPNQHTNSGHIPALQRGSRSRTWDNGTEQVINTLVGITKITKSKIRQKYANTYTHEPIDPEGQIRILTILPGEPESDIVCRLSQDKLVGSQTPTSDQRSDIRSYQALSYWWGEIDEIPQNRITLQHSTVINGNQQTMHNRNTGFFYVRKNLNDALVNFRSQEHEVHIWTDAICINQEDIEEKKAQVKRMHDVYTQADSTCIWLGSGRVETFETFEFLRHIIDLSKLDTAIKDSLYVESTRAHYAKKWCLVIKLMTNRWFSRRWVIQELALSRNAVVKWGDQTMDWPNFADAIAFFMTKYKDIHRECLSRIHLTGLETEQTLDAEALGANTIIHATTNLFRKSRNGIVERRLVPLEILVSSLLLAFEASNPRDTIYAVITLASDGPYGEISNKIDDRIEPDYGKTILDVYTDFVAFCIEKSGSLDILCRPWAPTSEPKENLPTWISLLKNAAHGTPNEALRGRVNGDSFTGKSERHWHHQRTYNASAGRTLTEQPRFIREGSKFNGSLIVHGFCLDEIQGRSGRVDLQGTISKKAFTMSGWMHHHERVPDALWRTIVADRGPSGTSVPSWYQRVCLECLQHIDTHGNLNTKELRRNPDTPSMMVNLLERVQQVIVGRRFFKTKGNPASNNESLFGLGNHNMEKGDKVCILFGCSVPVVLREVQDAVIGKYYQFIGECYLHGMMDGEAITPDMEDEQFHIR